MAVSRRSGSVVAGMRRPGQTLGRSAVGAVVAVAVYETLRVTLVTEAQVRRGTLSRLQQQRLVLQTLVRAVRDGALASLAGAAVLLVCPWLAGPLAALGVVGLAQGSAAMLEAWWQGLEPAQQRALHQLAHGAGVTLGRRLGGQALS